MSNNFETLFVVAGKRIENLSVVMSRMSDLLQCTKFTIVCPKIDLEIATKVKNKFEINIIDESDLIENCNTKVISELIPIVFPPKTPHNYAGWYYQQFLKMAYSGYPGSESNYLIWDADTVPLRKFEIQEGGKILFTQGREFHRPYFETINKLFNGGVQTPKVSHISQHMLVNKFDMLAMLSELSSHGVVWWEFVLKNLQLKSFQQFSEYETYSSFCLSRWPDRYGSVRREWFRHAKGLLRKNMHDSNLHYLSRHYDFAAFEEWDTGMISSLRAWATFIGDRLYSSTFRVRSGVR